MQRILAAFLALLFIPIAAWASEVENGGENTTPLRIYTEENPPFNYSVKGQVQGAYVDVVLEVLRRAGIHKKPNDMVVIPWARGYKETLLRKNTMLFAVVRTPERESSFKWVGPLGEYRAVILARRDRQLDLTSPEKLKKYTFAVTKKSLSEDFLLALGVPQSHLVYINSPKSAAHMLARGRIDAWSRDQSVARWTLQTLGYTNTDYEVVHAFSVKKRYMAFNIGTDDTLIEKLQTALDELRQNGRLSKIIKKDTALKDLPPPYPAHK